MLSWIHRATGFAMPACATSMSRAPIQGRGEAHEPESHIIPLILDVALGRRPSIKIFGRTIRRTTGPASAITFTLEDLAEAHLLAFDGLDRTIDMIYNLVTGGLHGAGGGGVGSSGDRASNSGGREAAAGGRSAVLIAVRQNREGLGLETELYTARRHHCAALGRGINSSTRKAEKREGAYDQSKVHSQTSGTCVSDRRNCACLQAHCWFRWLALQECNELLWVTRFSRESR